VAENADEDGNCDWKYHEQPCRAIPRPLGPGPISNFLLAAAQVAHLLIDCPGQRIKLLARGRSGKVRR
jgi:hypothetical protein